MAERAHPEDPGFQEGSPYRANLFKRYAFANKFTKGKTVLDVPCGVGWGTSLLKGEYIIGIDIDAGAVAYGKKHYPSIDFLVGNMANIPLKDNSVDVVVCLEGFEHVSKDTGTQFLAEAVRVIKENGLLVMTVPVILPGGNHSGNPYHLHEPALSDLKNIVAHKFYTQSMEIVKGPDGPVVYFVGSPKDKTNMPIFSHEERSVRYPKKNTSNILLTTSAAPTQSPFSTGEKRPPIGIGFLISSLRNAGHKVFFIDNYLQPSNFLETDYLRENEIDYIGIYANTICFRDTLRMMHKLEHLRQTNKWNGKIVVGGPHTTVAVNTIPDFVDYVVQGEGEQAILDIVEGKVTQRLVSYPRIENLDVLPMPAWDYFVKLSYNWNVRFFEDQPVFTMNTSRGCPFRCQFCSVGSIWGKKYTYFSAERIVSDIEYLIKNYGTKGIYFREDNFTLNKERLKKFCNLIIEKGIKISWVCESRVSNLNRDIVELMSRAGLRGFYFGVESGSQRILDFLQKDITVGQIRDVFQWCHEFNIKTAASVIVGVPGETESDSRRTSELLKQIKPDVVWNNVFVGIPDSNLYRIVLDNRLYEYIDERGLVYLQGHNDRVQRYYGNGLNACIPDDEKNKDMTCKPKISVLISVYNGERYIEQALKSIYKQTYRDFEVIIIDDASTDRTAEIVLKMKDSRTFIYRNSQKKGLTRSLNIGIKLCRGEYIARMDADDISRPQRFEKQIEFLKEHPDCVVLGCWCDRIDSNGQIHGAYDGRPIKPTDIKRGLLDGNCIAHPTAMVRRALLVEVGGYNEKYAYAQDHDLWLRLSERGQIYNLDEYLVGLRFWPENITAKKREQQDKCSELAIQEALQRRKAAELADAVKCHEQESDWKPKFSIVMANYNNAKYIAEAIESILRQKFEDGDWELIIVEDCSTDNSLKIINHYLNDKRIRLIRHEWNRGYATALKTGVEHVRSEYFGILDSDDCLTSSAIETMYSYHVGFPDCGLIYSQFMHCHEDLTPRQIGFGAEVPPGKTDLETHVASAFRTFKMRDYLKTSGYDEGILYAEDRDICYKMEEVTRLKYVNQCLYLYRELPNSQSHEPVKASIGRQSRERARLNALRRRGLMPMEAKQQKSEPVVLEQFAIGDRYVLGSSYLKAGRYSEAQITLEPILESLTQHLKCGRSQLSGRDLNTYNNMAECYLSVCTKIAQCYVRQGKYDKVKQIYSHLFRNQYIDLPEEQKASIHTVLTKLDNIELPAVGTEHNQPNFCDAQVEPLVSVIMPAYNAAEHIAEAIESVLIQNYRNFELIVVNDGSTDDTKDIVFSFKDERIKYFYHENSGLAATHNAGIKKSEGSFLIKLDHDDMMTADFIAAHLAEFEKHPDVDLVYCDDCLIDENSKPIRVIERPEYTDRKLLIRDLFHCGFPVVPFRTCIRRSVFDKIGFFDEELLVGEDYDMMRRFVKHGLKIHHLKGAMYLRRMTSDSLSRNCSAQKAKSHFDVVKRFTDTFTYDELFPDIEWDKIAPQIRQLHAKCLTAGTYLAIGQDYVKTKATECSRIAFDLACSELNDCVKMDPKNQGLRQLSQQLKLIRAKYTEAPQQVVS